MPLRSTASADRFRNSIRLARDEKSNWRRARKGPPRRNPLPDLPAPAGLCGSCREGSLPAAWISSSRSSSPSMLSPASNACASISAAVLPALPLRGFFSVAVASMFGVKRLVCGRYCGARFSRTKIIRLSPCSNANFEKPASKIRRNPLRSPGPLRTHASLKRYPTP